MREKRSGWRKMWTGQAAAAVLFLELIACQTYKLEQQLTPKYSRFYSQVTWIMTKQERQTFLRLPDTEKGVFIEEFWKKRDPSPNTEKNEFRIEYESRVAMAEKLFHSEGKPGWMTDRGRIYILFGPPWNRTMSPAVAGYCQEIWYYGTFPVLFVDKYCIGHFMLEAINLEHLAYLNIAQGYFQKAGQPRGAQEPERKMRDYDLTFSKTRDDAASYEGTIRMTIPYRSIGFALKGGRLEASFEVRARAYDEGENVLWEFSKDESLTMDEKQLKALEDKVFVIDIPLAISAGKLNSAQDGVTVEVTAKNTADDTRLRRTLKLRAKN